MTDSSIVAAVRAAATPLAAEPAPMTGVVAQKDHDAAVAKARADGLADGKAEGVKEGASAERKRIASIIDHENAKSRESLARHFAFATDMPAEAAVAALAAAPKEAGESGLLAEMKNVKQPPLGADGGREQSQMNDYDKGAAAAKALKGFM